MQDASRRAGKIRRAVRVALFNGWGTAIFAAVTITTGFLSAPALGLGTVMAVVAWVEFRGAAHLRQLDPTAPKSLAINQLCLGAALMCYAAFQLIRSLTGQAEITAAVGEDAQLQSMLAPIESLTRMIYVTLYSCLILIAIVVQGGTALYYLGRKRYLERYIAETPAWIVELNKKGLAM